MLRGRKYLQTMASAFALALVVFSCKSNLKEAEHLDLDNIPLQQVDGMFFVQTENGKLKMRVEAPVMQVFEKDTLSYDLFPKGLEVYAYAEDGSLETTITSNEAQDIMPMWIGQEIYFISDRDHWMNVFVYNTATKTTTKVTAGKWTHWGELAGIDYVNAGQNEQLTNNNEQLDTLPQTIRKGCKGETVAEMQGVLERLGYDLGSCGVDGDFGRMTEKAVKAFQKDHGLKTDGICGPRTWKELMN